MTVLIETVWVDRGPGSRSRGAPQSSHGVHCEFFFLNDQPFLNKR